MGRMLVILGWLFSFSLSHSAWGQQVIDVKSITPQQLAEEIVKPFSVPKIDVAWQIEPESKEGDATEVLLLDQREFSFGDLVAIPSESSKICLFDLAAKKLAKTLNVGQPPGQMQFSRDSKWLLVSPKASPEIQVWDVASGEKKFTHKCDGKVHEFALHPSKELMAVSLASNEFYLVPLLGGDKTDLMIRNGEEALREKPFERLRWIQDGTILSGGNADMPKPLFMRLNESGSMRAFRRFGWGDDAKPIIRMGFGEHCMVGAGSEHIYTAQIHDGHRLIDKIQFMPYYYQISDIQMVNHDQFMVSIVSKWNLLEIYKTGSISYPVFVSLPLDNQPESHISYSGRWVVAPVREKYSTTTKGLNFFDLSAIPEAPVWKLGDAVYHWMSTNDFEKVDALAHLFEYRTEPASWDTSTTVYGTIQSLVRMYPSTHLHRNAERTPIETIFFHHSNSDLVRMVKATMKAGNAWQARGPGFANTVTEEGWKQFQKGVEESQALLAPLLNREKPPISAIALWLNLAKGSKPEQEELRRLLRITLKEYPQASHVHEEVAAMLLPRWGGEEGQLEKYADRVCEVIGGDDGDAMYSRIAESVVTFYGPRFFDEHTFDYDRIQKGLAVRSKQFPTDPRPVHTALFFALMADKPDDIQQFYRRIVQENLPMHRSMIWQRSRPFLDIMAQLARRFPQESPK